MTDPPNRAPPLPGVEDPQALWFWRDVLSEPLPGEAPPRRLVIRPVASSHTQSASPLLGYLGWIEGGASDHTSVLTMDDAEDADATELYLPRIDGH